jgi:hypothetical protein
VVVVVATAAAVIKISQKSKKIAAYLVLKINKVKIS